MRDEALAKRAAVGQYLREARARAGLSQVDLAEGMGIAYYTAISAIENGRITLPPERYAACARTLGIDEREFVRDMLRITNPHEHAILFGEEGEADND